MSVSISSLFWMSRICGAFSVATRTTTIRAGHISYLAATGHLRGQSNHRKWVTLLSFLRSAVSLSCSIQRGAGDTDHRSCLRKTGRQRRPSDTLDPEGDCL